MTPVATPEQLARKEIDRLLTLAGWEVCRVDQADAQGCTYVARGGTPGATGYSVQIQERDTRKKRWEQFGGDVGARDQIRTFRDKLFIEIFPGRTWAPKTLILAKGEAENGERPLDVYPAERVRHGWHTHGSRIERDARAKKYDRAASGKISPAVGDCSAKAAVQNGCFRQISSTMSGYHAVTQ
ncbi:MAG: type I restriction enzyme R subunit [Gammaproteobacteria bacterium]|nr:MAG: type I restriction enzyme R subunit [Gammaproteobacteria bacterium]TND04986.1 MAG: type I restriction enzyme, R subunit [Gammaproteobacteria bacterium]